MIHKGKENGVEPRVQIVVTKSLKKRLDNYTAQTGISIKHLVTTLIEKHLDDNEGQNA